jgi:hypothetical protein
LKDPEVKTDPEASPAGRTGKQPVQSRGMPEERSIPPGEKPTLELIWSRVRDIPEVLAVVRELQDGNAALVRGNQKLIDENRHLFRELHEYRHDLAKRVEALERDVLALKIKLGDPLDLGDDDGTAPAR